MRGCGGNSAGDLCGALPLGVAAGRPKAPFPLRLRMENDEHPSSVTSRLRTPIKVGGLLTCTVLGAFVPAIVDRWGVLAGVVIGLASLFLIASLRLPGSRPARWYDVALAVVLLGVVAGGSYCLRGGRH